MSAPVQALAMSTAPSGDDVLALALKHVGEKYVFGARVPIANANWQGPWDCAEFVSWCVYRSAGILFGVEPRHDPVRADAYSGYWAAQAREANALVAAEQAAGIAGAVILRVPQTNRTGHIVISDGKGGTVEAHSTVAGVCRNTLDGRRWDFGILVPGIRYFAGDAAVIPRPPGMTLRLAEPMIRGDSVKAIQKCLAKLGYSVGEVDGVFGPQTESAVQRFQHESGLVADGEVGEATLAALRAKKCKMV